jgi:hypothetical protein
LAPAGESTRGLSPRLEACAIRRPDCSR